MKVISQAKTRTVVLARGRGLLKGIAETKAESRLFASITLRWVLQHGAQQIVLHFNLAVRIMLDLYFLFS